MKCKECEPLLAAYASGDLSEQEALDCRTHLGACESCRRSLETYSLLVEAIVGEPEIIASSAEFAALTEALDRASLPAKPAREVSGQWQSGVPAFAAASLGVFALLVAALTAQAVGLLDVRSLVAYIRPPFVAMAAVVIVFVTSFVPIAVTAKRRPLNGMTFRG
jgi:anti-sigma factor RsiW